MEFTKVSVIGLGYIGLPTAILLAAHGVNVIGIEVKEEIVKAINENKISITEPGLEEIYKKVMKNGKLRASMKHEPAEAFIIAVPTPFKEGHKPDISYIKEAIVKMAPILYKGNIVILESTSPVGTTELVSKWLAERRPELSFPHQAGENADIQIAYCPERVLPGRTLKELIENNRIIGGLNKKASKIAVELYEIFVTGEITETNARTAEMCKLAENSFRDVNIAFANELSMICEEKDIDIKELIKLANKHPRVKILQPGCGVGGHCLAVDPWFLIDSNKNKVSVIKTAREVNELKTTWVSSKIGEAVNKEMEKTRRINDISIIFLGISYKPNTSDLRESPAIKIVKSIAKKGYKTFIIEPNITKLPEDLKCYNIKLITLNDAYKIKGIYCKLVNHKQFNEQTIDKIKSSGNCIKFLKEM